MSTKQGQWKLASDGDGHWYVIPADKAADWEKWRDLPEPDLSGKEPDLTAWEAPEYAEPVGGAPSLVTFNADGTYTIGGYGGTP